jgi:hypothetical protein
MTHNLDLTKNKYSEEELEKNISLFDNEDWHYMSCCQYLSEEFIEKHSDRLDWNYTSKYQKLSESFIEKHINYVNWYHISEVQSLSEFFIKKHINKINVRLLMLNKDISEEIKEEIKKLKEII